MSAEQAQGLLTGEFQEKPAATGSLAALRNISWRAILASIGHALKPEFFERRALSAAQKRVGTTAWLDGLRGVAALSVCTMHLCVFTHTNLELCYGAGIMWQRYNTSIAAYPIFRLPFTGGHFAVILFFTISGYVVPRRLIGLLHDGKQAEFVEAINAAMVRRAGRLFLPVAFSTLFLAFFWHITGIVTAFPQRQSNIFGEMWEWWKDQLKFWYYYRTGFLFTYYNAHTWTIPVDLRGSMNIFVWLFAVHQVRTRWRILLTALMLAHFIYASGAWYASFFAGMLTSELEMIYTNGVPVSLPLDPIINFFRKRPIVKHVFLHIMLFVGLWLASQPSSDMHSREETMDCGVWKHLNKLIPGPYDDGNSSTYRWYWLFWAAWIILLTVGQINWVKWIFETGPAQCKSENTRYVPTIADMFQILVATPSRSTSSTAPSLVCGLIGSSTSRGSRFPPAKTTLFGSDI
jgi:peptidoglycan/LPS O-acetylase OafA/YrhL